MQILRFSATAADWRNTNAMIPYNITPMMAECITITKPRSAIIIPKNSFWFYTTERK